METVVRAKAKHIRAGRPGDCCRCAVALALREAAGDDHANVYERDWAMYLEVHGRHVLAPAEVVRFVWGFDALDRRKDGRSKLPRRPEGALAPFEFTLPPDGSPEWEERCCQCEELFDPAALDGEGLCPECREGNR